jgi:hypothetical protein
MKLFNRLIEIAYCVGASIVILGALFKIIHLAGANTMLTIGLVTEACIFLLMIFEKKEVAGGYSMQSSSSDNSELTGTLKETNTILKSIFKVK